MFVTGLAIQMATVLMRHSSEELCEAIRAHLPSFLKVLDRLESARDLCSVVEEIDALQVH
jgi:hypothetical protein